MERINVSRTGVTEVELKGKYKNLASIGASYTHIRSLQGIISESTERVVMYHSFLETLAGFEDTNGVEIAYLGFNRIASFDTPNIPKIGVLDLAGNPLKSLVNCPPCDTLIVSSTLITDLTGGPQGVKILRCGHSTHLRSLRGCPSIVVLIECSCSPNLVLDMHDIPANVDLIID